LAGWEHAREGSGVPIERIVFPDEQDGPRALDGHAQTVPDPQSCRGEGLFGDGHLVFRTDPRGSTSTWWLYSIHDE
jgi:hypothetical protein